MLTLFKDPFFDTIDRVFYPYCFNDNPEIDIRKTDNEYKVLISIPGLTKDDLKISVKDRILRVSYEKEEKNEKSYFMTSFSKSYTLPDNIKESDIDGKVENGILELILPFDKKKITERLIELK
jgi:HSP20 family protein